MTLVVIQMLDLPAPHEWKIGAMKAGDFLIESGLLFEINRRILHPLGLAMVATLEEDGSHKINDILFDGRHIPGGLEYDQITLVLSEDRLFEFMDEFGVGKMQERKRIKGYVLQKSEEKRVSTSI